jgi:hypothetical protein
MKNLVSTKLAVVAAVLVVAAPLWAHHGSAGFSRNKPVHFIGKISQLDWSNPHVLIHLDVTGAEGKTATWLVATRPPNPLLRTGFSKNDLATGTTLTVDGYQADDGSNHVNASNIVFPDGRKIETPGCFDASGRGLSWAESKQCVN